MSSRFAWLVVLCLGTVTEWAIRPQVLSLALFVLALQVVTSHRGAERSLPVLCLVWANLHGLVIAGVLVAICAVVEAALWPRARRCS